MRLVLPACNSPHAACAGEQPVLNQASGSLLSECAKLWLLLVCTIADVAVAAAGLHQIWHRICSQHAAATRYKCFSLFAGMLPCY